MIKEKNITIFWGENKEVQILALYFSNITKRNIMRASIDKFESVLTECTDRRICSYMYWNTIFSKPL